MITVSAQPKELTIDQSIQSVTALKKYQKDSLSNIVCCGVLHRKINLVDWINGIWELLGPKGILWVTVPMAENAWKDPFAVREMHPDTFAAFDKKSESYNRACKPFTAVFCNVTGNDLHVRLVK